MDENVACPACGAVFGSEARCTFCGEGVRYAGHGFRFRESGRRCPRCGEARELLSITFDGVSVDVCEHCEGAWFDAGELEHVVQDVRAQAKSGRWSPEAVLDGGTKSPSPLGQGYIPCPRCGQLMNRLNWEKTSGVVVDVCRSHGVWLDGGEIASLQAWAARTPDGPPRPAAEREPVRPLPEVKSVLSMPVQHRVGGPGLLDFLFRLFG